MKKLGIHILLIFCCFCGADADDFLYHGSFLWNDIRAVVQQGDYLFAAFHDGVASIALNESASSKTIATQLEMEGNPFRLHLFGDLLLVEKEDGIIDLVSVADPENLQKLASYPAPPKLFDIEVVNDLMYFALGYEGLVRYDISEVNNIVFDDSSLVGINVTALHYDGSYLYVLDNYNGVLIYSPTPDSIGAPLSELLLPRQAVSMTVASDTVYAGIRPTGFMVGYTGDKFNPVYLESRNSFIRADYIAKTASGLVIYNSLNGFELIYNDPPNTLDHFYPVQSIQGYGMVFRHNMSDYIVFPDRARGMAGYNIDDPDLIDQNQPEFDYRYPGPINQLVSVGEYLHVIGPGNPYEIYDIANPDQVILQTEVVNPFYRSIGVCQKDDTLFVADEEINSIFTGVDDGAGGFDILPRFFSVMDNIKRPFIGLNFFPDGDLVYFFTETNFNGSFRSAESVEPNLIRWNFEDGITAILPTSSLVYRVSTDNKLHVHSIDRYYETDEKAVFDLPGRTEAILILDTLLYLGGDDLLVVNIADPLLPSIIDIISEPDEITEIDLKSDEIICAADNGVFIFDISGGLPQLRFSGGTSAVTVAKFENLIAASDGRSVKLYSLPATYADRDEDNLPGYGIPRLTGYPNPFNLAISLKPSNFNSRDGDLIIDIYDILGRKLNRLEVPAQNLDHEIVWDGMDELGRPVASGVYLFQAHNSVAQSSLRAVLIK